MNLTMLDVMRHHGVRIKRIEHQLADPEQAAVGHTVGEGGCESIVPYNENGGLGPELWLRLCFKDGAVAFTAARHYWIYCEEVDDGEE